MRYQTKLLVTAGLLLAMSLSAATLAYWGVAQSHTYLTRSRIAHDQLERQLQLSRHSQQLFKAWTDTLLTGITDRPLGAAYLHKVIDSDLATLQDLSEKELALVGPEESKAESAELERLAQIKGEFQHTLDQLGEVEQLRSRGRPDIAWQRLIDLLKGGIDQKLNALIEVAVAERLSKQEFSDIPSLVRAFVGAAGKTFASDETLYRIVFDSRTQNPVLNQIGLSGRHRIFAAYRDALLPFLDGVPKSRAELLVRVSFHLLAAAIVGKARVDDGALADLSWNVLESEIGTAAIAYLETSIRAGAKPIRPTRIRTSGTRKAR